VKTQLTLTRDPIDEAALLRERVLSSDMGAVVSFLGFVRDLEDGRTIQGLEYEAFPAMAEHQFGKIFAATEQRWPVSSIRLVHRLGKVAVNEPSLWVEVVAPHRGEAFAAGQYLIDQMKLLVPIWKKAF
jgi:molybdopterin synthase catalytic subunit